MKDVGVSFSALVQELAALRQTAAQGLNLLKDEQDKLEDKIRRAQERHQTVTSLTDNKSIIGAVP